MNRVVKAIAGMTRPRRVAVSVLLLLGATGGASAQGGLMDFLSQAFGGGGATPVYEPLPQPDSAGPGPAPPLTVRARPHRPRSVSIGGSQRYNVADLKGITMYTDKTLMRGDAVMTPGGIKVFTGSPVLPHTDEDFVSFEDVAKMSKGMRKELTAMNDASRPELAR